MIKVINTMVILNKDIWILSSKFTVQYDIHERRIKEMRRTIVGILIFIISIALNADSGISSGLEVSQETKVYVLVEITGEEAKAIGLTKEHITSKVELQLRKNGIAVGTNEEALASGLYLYVTCNVIGKAFSVSIEFQREVSYRVGNKLHTIYAPTYIREGTGTHGSKRNYIVQALVDYIDEFSNDFLKSN